MPGGYARSEESVKAESLVVGLKAVKTSDFCLRSSQTAQKVHSEEKNKTWPLAVEGRKKTWNLLFVVRPNS